MPTTQATPFLMFQGNAEEAIGFYIETLPNSQLLELVHYGPEGPGGEGKVLNGRARIAGMPVMFHDSPIAHSFSFTPALSLWVDCVDEAEFSKVYQALTDRGEVLMAPASYGFSQRFAWVNDRFRVSWQINLPG